MKIREIIWLKHFLDKIEDKHGVTHHEVEQIFANRARIQFGARGDIRGEDLYRAIGRMAGVT